MISMTLIYMLAGGLGGALALFVLAGFRFVPNRMVGVVEKRWSARGSIEGGLIALDGEAGFQPDVLRGGIWWLTPLQYRVHLEPLVTIPQGKIGYVFARDGAALPAGQTLASNLRARSFEDARDFLANGGQRGPQRQILREGAYAINLALFAVITKERAYALPLGRDDAKVLARTSERIAACEGFEPVVIDGVSDEVGVVTVHDGPSLPQGHIIAPTVGAGSEGNGGSHDGFQDPEKFLLAGGRRGRQLEVLVDGTYFLNALFATVERIAKTVVEVGNVGVVVWYAGEFGADLTGADYKHGELVRRGERGVWSEPLLPGKYPFNTYAGSVIMVPTTNFILKWIRCEAGEHKYDENLAEVSLITKDAFEPRLPLSVVVHIGYTKAPLVIQRFGNIRRLVEQTLDPMVSAYFKNVGQTRTLIQLLQDRSAIQAQAGEEMKAKFAHYNLELEEVLIGTPTSTDGSSRIEEILMQLRARQVAEEQVETFARQEKAAVKERELREAEARASQQEALTRSELNVSIATNEGKAEYGRAVQEAARIRALAEAEAERAARLGVGQAIAIDEQVRAYGGPQFQLAQQVMTRFAEAIEKSGVDVVPKMVVGGADGGKGGSNLLEALMAMLMSEQLGKMGAGASAAAPRSKEMTALREVVARKEGGDDVKLATR